MNNFESITRQVAYVNHRFTNEEKYNIFKEEKEEEYNKEVIEQQDKGKTDDEILTQFKKEVNQFNVLAKWLYYLIFNPEEDFDPDEYLEACVEKTNKICKENLEKGNTVIEEVREITKSMADLSTHCEMMTDFMEEQDIKIDLLDVMKITLWGLEL